MPYLFIAELLLQLSVLKKKQDSTFYGQKALILLDQIFVVELAVMKTMYNLSFHKGGLF